MNPARVFLPLPTGGRGASCSCRAGVCAVTLAGPSGPLTEVQAPASFPSTYPSMYPFPSPQMRCVSHSFRESLGKEGRGVGKQRRTRKRRKVAWDSGCYSCDGEKGAEGQCGGSGHPHTCQEGAWVRGRGGGLLGLELGSGAEAPQR